MKTLRASKVDNLQDSTNYNGHIIYCSRTVLIIAYVSTDNKTHYITVNPAADNISVRKLARKNSKSSRLPRGCWNNHNLLPPRKITTETGAEPKDDIDLMTVERILDGDISVFSTLAERNLAIDILDVGRLSTRQIAMQLKCSIRTIERRRKSRKSSQS